MATAEPSPHDLPCERKDDASKAQHPLIMDGDVFGLTAKGRNELRGSATSLAPSVLEVLVLIDGTSTIDETAGRVRSIGKEAAVNTLGKLFHAA